jgi:RNA polymerase I-specific transcription initiation factor RRN3
MSLLKPKTSSSIALKQQSPPSTTTSKQNNQQQLQQQQQQQDVNIDVKLLLENYLHQTDATKYEFDYFISILKNKQSEPVFIESILKQLKPLIPLLDPRQFESNLISVLFFEIKWPQHYSNNESILALLADFLVDLNSAYTNYIQKCLSMLIKLFQCTSTPTHTVDEETKQETTQQPINSDNLYKLAHNLILQLVKIAPTCKTILIKQLDQYYPYMIKETSVQEAYIRNLLQLAESFADLRLQILEICVQKLLKIDVNCRREQILEYELMHAEANSNTSSTEDAHKQELSMKHHLADRLDVMMLCLFNYINKNCFSGTTIDWDATKVIYKDLLSIFDKYILVTYGSNHVQFLMFYICSFRVQLAEGFLDYLWKKFNSIKSCSVTKQICAYYLGSLLARAKFISLSTCIATLQLMVSKPFVFFEVVYLSFEPIIFIFQKILILNF